MNKYGKKKFQKEKYWLLCINQSIKRRIDQENESCYSLKGKRKRKS